MLPGLPKLQAGGQGAAEPGQAAPHPVGRQRSGAGLLLAAGRRARARCGTGEEQINGQRDSELPQVTRSLGSAPLPPTQAFLRRRWIYETDPRSVPSTPARRAACDSSLPSSCLPPRGPPSPEQQTLRKPTHAPLLAAGSASLPFLGSQGCAGRPGLSSPTQPPDGFPVEQFKSRKIPLKQREREGRSMEVCCLSPSCG